jgi:hypothetical protein
MFLLLIFAILFIALSNSLPYDDPTCFNKICKDCNQDTDFTDDEIQRAGRYIQQRFSVTNPSKPPCARFHVRKDIKCLTDSELKSFIKVFKQLYSDGTIDEFVAIHVRYWAGTHKFSEGTIWHRWLMNELEKRMMALDPNVTLPYWNHLNCFAHPELDKVFDLFGHGGDPNNDHCVTDGAFANVKVSFFCLKFKFN